MSTAVLRRSLLTTGSHLLFLSPAASFGRLITDIDLEISKVTRDVKTVTAKNVIVTRDVMADPTLNAFGD
jgi:hypothetical protein